jgi:hypothetical protein
MHGVYTTGMEDAGLYIVHVTPWNRIQLEKLITRAQLLEK